MSCTGACNANQGRGKCSAECVKPESAARFMWTLALTVLSSIALVVALGVVVVQAVARWLA